MTQPKPASPAQVAADIEHARHLIPGFLKKTLSADDQVWMTQFLETLSRHGGVAAADFGQEIAWVQRSQEQLAQAAPSFDAQAGWQRMQSRLDAAAPLAMQRQPIQAKSTALAGSWTKALLHKLINRAAAWWRKPLVGVLASAMIIAQMGLLAVVGTQMRQVQTATVSATPSSGAPSLEGLTVLTIVFKDNASMLDVRALIDSIQGRVIDGPGALGVWQVAVPKDKLDASLKRLSASNAIESAAPQ